MDIPELEVTVTHQGNVVVARPLGWITNYNAQSLDERLKHLLDDGSRRIVLDLAAADFVSSTGLGVIMFYKMALKDRGGCLLLACVPESVRRNLVVAKLDKLLKCSGTVAEAVNLATQWSESGRLRAMVTV